MDGEAKVPSGQHRIWQSVVWDSLEPKKVACAEPGIWQSVVRHSVEPKGSNICIQGASRTRDPSSYIAGMGRQCRQTVSLFDTLSPSWPLQLESNESQQEGDSTGNAQRDQNQSESGPYNGANASCSRAELQLEASESQQEGDSAGSAQGDQNQSESGPRNGANASYIRGETDDEDDDPLHELERHRQVLAQQMMMEANAHGANVHGAFIQSWLPVDSDGKPTSIGSFGHASGTCKVCICTGTSPGCSNGVECSVCRLQLRRTRQQNKMRPCKGKRERRQKLLSRLKIMIESNPDSFSMEQVDLPPSIAGDEAVKARLVAQVHQHLLQVRASLGQETGSARSFFGTF